MIHTLKTCTAYISVRTNQHGKRVWTVLSHNQPLCADTDYASMLSVARQHWGDVMLSVWDGDKGEFTHDVRIHSNTKEQS